jgi:hypothetical protein
MKSHATFSGSLNCLNPFSSSTCFFSPLIRCPPRETIIWAFFQPHSILTFTIRPYAGKLARTLKVEPKLCLFDILHIPAEYRGKRLENLTALHLLKACQFWTDTAQGEYDLRFIRTRDGWQAVDAGGVQDGRKGAIESAAPIWRNAEAEVSSAVRGREKQIPSRVSCLWCDSARLRIVFLRTAVALPEALDVRIFVEFAILGDQFSSVAKIRIPFLPCLEGTPSFPYNAPFEAPISA